MISSLRLWNLPEVRSRRMFLLLLWHPNMAMLMVKRLLCRPVWLKWEKCSRKVPNESNPQIFHIEQQERRLLKFAGSRRTSFPDRFCKLTISHKFLIYIYLTFTIWVAFFRIDFLWQIVFFVLWMSKKNYNSYCRRKEFDNFLKELGVVQNLPDPVSSIRMGQNCFHLTDFARIQFHEFEKSYFAREIHPCENSPE